MVFLRAGHFASLAVLLVLALTCVSAELDGRLHSHRRRLFLTQPVKEDAVYKTGALMTCLGPANAMRANKPRIKELIQANPHPSSDRVWFSLRPSVWGFEAVDASEDDSWSPLMRGQVVTAKIASNRARLTHCLRQEGLAAPVSSAVPRGSADGSLSSGSRGAHAVPESKAAPKMINAAPAGDFATDVPGGPAVGATTPPVAGAPTVPGQVNGSSADGSKLGPAIKGADGAPASTLSADDQAKDAAIAAALEQAKTSGFGQGMPQLAQNITTTPVSTCKKYLIRKEYSTLTVKEKTQYVNALKCVQRKPSRFKSDPGWNAMDDWTLLHIRMMHYVHFTAYFLPFHRGFSAIVERDLNDCGFPLGLPWVDWTKTAEDPSVNAIFDSNPRYGLGTNGRGTNSSCPWHTGREVTDGAMAGHWFNAPFRHKLCRQFNNLDVKNPNEHFGANCTTFISESFVKGLAATHNDGSFFDFSSAVEISLHLAMHTSSGGSLAWLSTSANDYVFHSHHAFVDNIWNSWAKRNPKNARAFHGPQKQQKGGAHPPWTAKRTDPINYTPLAPDVTVNDLLDHTSGKWGGRMCYKYDRDIDL